MSFPTAAIAEPPPAPPRKDPSLVLAHAAMASMLQNGLSPTPANYLIWFSYHGGSEPGLRYALDAALEGGGRIAQPRMDELHAQFFEAGHEALSLHEMSRRLEGAVSEAVTLVDGAREAATRYGGSLREASDGLSDGPEALGAVLQRLVAETREVSRRSDAAARRLTETARKTQELHAQLAEARRQATTDPLTGLANRRCLDEALRAGLEEAGTLPLALVMVDVDHFKAVNDTHGHHVGDDVLRLLAATLSQALGAGQDALAARFGGEEFCVILRGHGLQEAARTAEAIRARVGGASLLIRQGGQHTGQRLGVTVSLGLAVAEPGEAAAHLVERADAALYEAKRGGRNRLCTDPPMPKSGAVWG
ncbi:GGDEF domain-containing protein [Roseococcus sp. SYP-B2431]|uniref:GGDEF domain-containing protein n=1 Tax=Roseococcus sp. SYP-B2431 TaxID=2496640 RepID=UPI0013F45DAB|nr:GGDEF domain-containing protein [Roseococcus sp. SYP-B2431]